MKENLETARNMIIFETNKNCGFEDEIIIEGNQNFLELPEFYLKNLEKGESIVERGKLTMTTPEEYRQDEEDNLQNLQERIELLKKKWFKTDSIRKEIEFLEKYIELKQKLIDNL